MTQEETSLLNHLQETGVQLSPVTWETCRNWLTEAGWKINVLSDYPQGEIKFTVRKGFERIELSGHSDLEVMLKAISEIKRRSSIEKEEYTDPEFEQ